MKLTPISHIPSSVPSSDRLAYVRILEEHFPLHEKQEDAKLCTGAAYREQHKLLTVPYHALADTEINGFPIYIQRNERGILEATFCQNTHALIIGSTGSGKTTGFVVPFLNWMSAKKNKPSIIVSDPKSELNEKTLNRFLENGYRVFWLNFMDSSVSDCWNPLTKIYRLYQQYLHVEQEVTVVQENGKAYNRFRGIVYHSQQQLDVALHIAKTELYTQVEEMIGNIATAMSPVVKETDPYWDQISSTFLQGFLWAMLEDSVPDKEEGRITEETFSFDTLIKIYDSFQKDSDRFIDDHGYFSNRNPKTSKAYQLVTANIIKLTAHVTRNCIISCFGEKIEIIRNSSVRQITRANTIDFSLFDDEEHPTVIFISYKDEDSLFYSVISLFLGDLCTVLTSMARKKNGSLLRSCYFLLDEFGNFPAFKDFEKTISTCRSRNMWFLLIVQSYAQLHRVYEEKVTEIIKDNLNMHIFFGSCNYDTKVAFSKECGEHEIIAPQSAINGDERFIQHYTHEKAPLIPVSRLSQLAEGDCIITQMRGDVIWSHIERSYLCPEYDNGINVMKTRLSPVLERYYDYTYDLDWLFYQGNHKKLPNLLDP